MTPALHCGSSGTVGKFSAVNYSETSVTDTLNTTNYTWRIYKF